MNASQLPDISSEPFLQINAYPLDWVGMENIALPLYLHNTLCSSQVNAYVSLDDPNAKGIHMSRLYTRLLNLSSARDLTLNHLQQALQDFLFSHQQLSKHARIDIQSELQIERPALISELSGWKSYPFSLLCELKQQSFQAELTLEIPYSSTCPCSAALARDLIQKSFQKAVHSQQLDITKMNDIVAWLGTTDAIVATPHSQRSFAQLKFKLAKNLDSIPFMALINHAEQALATPVQTAVKRMDEQAFALANGQNLMFCEDALRRLFAAFEDYPYISGFHFKVIHAESLHAHDAVAQGSWRW
ncbi:GTP cyclohydrolase FolE2 [Acinetobacter baumannii]|uniref:GTP cyclohydrolase FolE2 n=1 Tax=Acinetobacter baumannii TaxID=470 RepID=UPI0011E681A3|nr:GTP cyclohydrolase FolE2 [Acinetobacter baumannii]MDC4298731.1 GTP cyclohydrolase FolE2 [Acinetobacter baumannii]MDC4302470.1 GTP cyclohydrolase FolE2 [Acinetobacter baumannii]MDC4330361.1 GTP cyclohydrolase FolE2 [Acinetobacter baumannii]MDC4514390.1 GTP cyclohydrolase FolE2 [Acinetobacter baumannii]MDC4524320.1 GTP cyclohydrolase FolE2 [Acinetobacter baumannii]